MLAISAFEFFYRVFQPATYLLFPVVLLVFISYNKKFNFSVFKIIIPFFCVFVLQNYLNGIPFYYALTLVVRLLVFYMTMEIIGNDFINIFINTIKVIAVISIFFYMIQYNTLAYNFLIDLCKIFTNLGSDPQISPDKPNFIIYTIETKSFYDFQFFRNTGPFWEPGLYVAFLNIALFFNMLIQKKLLNRLNLLFIISIITAFSTTGTIVLFINIIIYLFISKSLKLQYRFFLIVIVLTAIPFISSLSFMKDKIDSQLNQSNISYSRFGAIVVHWNIIQAYPYAGLPYDDNKTYDKFADNISPNGITEIFIRYGVFVGLFYYILMFRSNNILMKYLGYPNKGFALFLILTVSIFSENIGNRPIYLMLLFIPMLNDFKPYVDSKVLYFNKKYSSLSST